MKNKKIFLSFIIVLIIIFIVGFFSIKIIKEKKSNSEEYIPEEEISDEQLRETIVTLYFVDKDTNQIKPEARLINVKDLIISPYNVIIELLISGPKNENLKSVLPENTRLLSSYLNGECLTLDFSEELLNNNDEKENIINSIVKTITELNEVNEVKILVNGLEY